MLRGLIIILSVLSLALCGCSGDVKQSMSGAKVNCNQYLASDERNDALQCKSDGSPSLRSQNISEAFQSWIGKYTFAESKSNIAIAYEINIYEENERLFAFIEIDGHMTFERIKASIVGNQEEIDVIFEKFAFSPVYTQDLSQNDVLFHLSKEKEVFWIEWDQLQPMFKESRAKQIIWFNEAKQCSNKDFQMKPLLEEFSSSEYLDQYRMFSYDYYSAGMRVSCHIFPYKEDENYFAYIDVRYQTSDNDKVDHTGKLILHTQMQGYDEVITFSLMSFVEIDVDQLQQTTKPVLSLKFIHGKWTLAESNFNAISDNFADPESMLDLEIWASIIE